MNRLEIPEFAEKKELFKFLSAHKKTLIAQKKNIIKFGDEVSFSPVSFDAHKYNVVKQLTTVGETRGDEEAPLPDLLQVKAVINTTNWFDSHYDVHLPGIWDKSLSENRMIMHVESHKSNDFSKIIADGEQLQAFVETFTWRSLGVPINGKTQALVFESDVLRERNEFMLKQYLNGWVKNHSVGMRYMNLVLCIDDPDAGAEFEAWEKYFPMVANKEDADNRGFMFVVKEAKVIEGSAVPLGSNIITPTISTEIKNEPPQGTQDNEPSHDTQNTENFFTNLI